MAEMDDEGKESRRSDQISVWRMTGKSLTDRITGSGLGIAWKKYPHRGFEANQALMIDRFLAVVVAKRKYCFATNRTG